MIAGFHGISRQYGNPDKNKVFRADSRASVASPSTMVVSLSLLRGHSSSDMHRPPAKRQEGHLICLSPHLPLAWLSSAPGPPP
jgi:hypothetical protein